MKKRNILQNSMIATVCIILCKIIGLIYVIPFNAMISKSAGALYSYAYNIYVIFFTDIQSADGFANPILGHRNFKYCISVVKLDIIENMV